MRQEVPVQEKESLIIQIYEKQNFDPKYMFSPNSKSFGTVYILISDPIRIID